MDAQSAGRHRGCRNNAAFAALLFLAPWLWSVSAMANSAGLNWLLAQQQPDGRIAAPADETLPQHASFEALRTLVHMGAPETVRAHAAAFVSGGSGDDLPFFARRLQAQHLVGSETAPAVADLAAYQNPDGGFASYPGDQSRVPDTLDALEALRDLDEKDPTIVGPAVAWLLTQQRGDGGFGSSEASPSADYLAARAVTLLRNYRFDFPVSAALEAAESFLWAQQNGGLWGSTGDSAHALLALMPLTLETPLLAPAITELRERQDPDGSWNGSVYATSLALRALHVFSNQGESTGPEEEGFRAEWLADPDDADPVLFPDLVEPQDGTSTVFGVVRDRATAKPVANALVTVGGTSVRSDPEGRYRVEGLMAAQFGISASATGYRLQSASFTMVQSGLLQVDIALEAVAIDGVQVRGLWIGREEYQAFEEVPVSVEIANTGDREQRLVLAGRVQGLSTGFAEDFLIPAPGGLREESFVLAPGQVVAQEFAWFTRNLPPQDYRLSVQILSEDRRNVFSQSSLLIRVLPTERVSSFALQATPDAFIRGESGEVEIAARIRNASNVDTRLKFNLTIVSPSGEDRVQESVAVDIRGDAVEQTVPVGSFAQLFDEAGMYEARILDVVGPALDFSAPARIDVAPNLRVEGVLDLEPAQIPPGSSREVRIRLSIEGMEDAP
jgi:hypothetical protein